MLAPWILQVRGGGGCPCAARSGRTSAGTRTGSWIERLYRRRRLQPRPRANTWRSGCSARGRLRGAEVRLDDRLVQVAGIEKAGLHCQGRCPKAEVYWWAHALHLTRAVRQHLLSQGEVSQASRSPLIQTSAVPRCRLPQILHCQANEMDD